jgi:hypothetical protein
MCLIRRIYEKYFFDPDCNNNLQEARIGGGAFIGGILDWTKQTWQRRTIGDAMKLSIPAWRGDYYLSLSEMTFNSHARTKDKWKRVKK